MPPEEQEVDALLSSLGLDGGRQPLADLPLGLTRLVEIGRALPPSPRGDARRAVLWPEPRRVEAAVAPWSASTRPRGTSSCWSSTMSRSSSTCRSGSSCWTSASLSRRGRRPRYGVIRVRAAYLGELAPASTARGRRVTVAEPPGAVRPEASQALLDGTRSAGRNTGTPWPLGGMSLTAPGGASTALLGLNGAGKSTLARALSGLVKAQPGRSGSTARISPAPRRPDPGLGLAYLPEGRGIFPSLTVNENLSVALQRLPEATERPAPSSTRSRCSRSSASGGGRPRGRYPAASSRCCRSRGCSPRQPRLLIADEISLGLAP